VTGIARAQAEDLLYREALYLDRRDWDRWLALYRVDAVFWVPAWRDEATTTADPDSELSLIYYAGRRNLEDRVWRIRSGLSVASTPLPRTVHAVSNVLLDGEEQGLPKVTASFTVHRYDVRSDRTHVFFGRYDYLLRREDDAWLIQRKVAFLFNDVIPTVLDVYSV